MELSFLTSSIIYFLNVQWMLWVGLYEIELRRFDPILSTKKYETVMLYAIAFPMLLFVIFFKQLGNYNSYHFMIYIVQILFSYYFMSTGPRNRMVVSALCMAFLIPFVNSLYWELPIHLMSILENGFRATTDITQILVHLGPSVYLWKFFKHPETDKWYANHLLTGWFIVSVYVAINHAVYEFSNHTYWIPNMIPHIVLRLIGCGILLRIMYRSEDRTIKR